VLFPTGECEHDVEPLRLERKKTLRIYLRHQQYVYQIIYIRVNGILRRGGGAVIGECENLSSSSYDRDSGIAQLPPGAWQ
jgi:hypothetical protein